MSAAALSVEEAAALVASDPRNVAALQCLADEVALLANRNAHKFRLSVQDRDDVFASVIETVWLQVRAGTFPREVVIPRLACWVRNRCLDVVRRRRTRPLDDAGGADGSLALAERLGADTTLQFDPLESLHLAFAGALADRREADRPSLQRAWNRFWRVVMEDRSLREVALDEGADEAAVSAATRAHSRLIAEILAQLAPEEQAEVADWLHLRSVSDPPGAPRPVAETRK